MTGDSREVIRTLPDKQFHTCVTSPPYFGLRDYGHDDQMGLEETPEKYVAAMVELFREVRRVLRDDGTVWLNLGDSYAGGGRGGNGDNITGRGKNASQCSHFVPADLKPKDLMGIPWRVAFALQSDGWCLRQDIIWAKPNPMPESVRDRCTKAHEYIFLLSKSPKYYYDHEAIKEPASYLQPNSPESIKSPHGQGFTRRAKGNRKTFRGGGKYTDNQSFDNTMKVENDSVGNEPNESLTRNKRSVWTVSTKPFSEAHFATFPPELIEPCILAGCPEGGEVLDPFGGAGTTGLVSQQNRRNCTLIEVNPDYVKLAEKRIKGDNPLFSEVSSS